VCPSPVPWFLPASSNCQHTSPTCRRLCKRYRKAFLAAGVCHGMPGHAATRNSTVLINTTRLFITRSYGVTNNSHINHIPFTPTREFKAPLETPCFFMWLVRKKLLFGAWEEWLCFSLCCLSQWVKLSNNFNSKLLKYFYCKNYSLSMKYICLKCTNAEFREEW